MAGTENRIGYLIPEFPSQTHSFFWREIQALENRHGYRTQIFSTRRPSQKVMHEWATEAEATYLFPPSPTSWPRLLWGLLSRGHRVLSRPDARRLLLTPGVWPFLLMAIRLGQLCQDNDISHLHVHSCGNSALIAAFCHLLYDLPYSIVLHGPLRDYGPYQDFKWRRALFAFIITDKLAQEMAERMPDTVQRSRIVPMGVDTDHFSPPEGLSSDGNAPFRWFCCARLNWVKGYDVLLRALAHIRQTHPELDLSLFIAGEDEQGGQGYRLELEKLRAELGLEEQVTLLGATTQKDVLQQLHMADGFVLASRAEPLGVAYMEAMACGLPTVGTAAGGVPELIESGRDGLLVPPEDPEALAGAMISIMSDGELRSALSHHGRSRIVDHFGASRSADALAVALQDFT